MASQSNLSKQDEPCSSTSAESLIEVMKTMKLKIRNLKNVKEQCLLCGRPGVLMCFCSFTYCCESCKVSDWAHHVKVCYKMSQLPDDIDDMVDFNVRSNSSSGFSSGRSSTSSIRYSGNSSRSSSSSSSSSSSTCSINIPSCSSGSSSSSSSGSSNGSGFNVEINPITNWQGYIKARRKAEYFEALKHPSYFMPAFLATPISPRSNCQIIINMFVSLNTFYIRSLKQHYAYASLLNAIQKFEFKTCYLFSLPRVGDIVMVKRNSYTYARVLITDVQNTLNITCFYIDYGDTVVRPLNDLKYLSLELQRAQRFISEIRLKNVPNIPMSALKAIVFNLLTNMVGNHGVLEFDGDYGIGKEVDLFTGERRILFNDELMKLYEKSQWRLN